MTIPDTQKEVPTAAPVTEGGDNLNEQLVATPVETPPPEAQPYLEVVAPATLSEGYTFNAEANGRVFTVTVPAGGVKEGQKFSVPLPAGTGANDGYPVAAIPRASVPVGAWKDGLCDCFRHGVIHPVLCNAWCFPLILAGQVMHRLKLTWLGDEGSIAQTTATFHILMRVTVVYFIVDYILKYLPISLVDENGYATQEYEAVLMVRMFLNVSFAIFTVILVAKTRKHIRNKYSIPEQQCFGCEDCCCAYWCTCCTVAQMARHTADYEMYPGLCCSETGLPPHAPSIDGAEMNSHDVSVV